MTIFEYMDKYGDYSFFEKPINEVDKLVFSFISYANFRSIRISGKEKLYQVYDKLEKNNKSGKNIIPEKDALKILKCMKNKKRYKDCLLFNHIYEVDNDYQFSAITIEYLKNNIYISFEGTDDMISSWYEDFLFSYKYPTISHKKAIKYLKRYTFSNYKIIVGGHSKGGNIALVAGMNANIFLNSKITEIFSADGPGLLPKVFNSRKFLKIQKKYFHFVPENSFVGMILENKNDIAIRTSMTGLLSHDILYWDVTYDSLTRTKLSSFSKTIRKKLNNYIYSLSISDLESIAGCFNDICVSANISSLIDIVDDNKKIIIILKEIAKLKGKQKKILFNIVDIIAGSLGQSISSSIKDKIDAFKSKVFG